MFQSFASMLPNVSEAAYFVGFMVAFSAVVIGSVAVIAYFFRGRK